MTKVSKQRHLGSFFYLRKEEIFSILFVQIAGIAQLVERHLAKVNVAGSNPVSRSR